jgi:glutamine phosphoribosylpyrophosphate amidotransferase
MLQVALSLPAAQDNGLVKDVFDKESMKVLDGSVGLGHVRYPTAGSTTAQEAQPFFVNSPLGIYLVRTARLSLLYVPLTRRCRYTTVI